MTPLQQAITLRMRCRAALKTGDLVEVSRLNALADGIYELLSELEAWFYIQWARDRVPVAEVDEYLKMGDDYD